MGEILMGGYVVEKTAARAFYRKAICLFLVLAVAISAFLLCRVPAEAREAVETTEEAEAAAAREAVDTAEAAEAAEDAEAIEAAEAAEAAEAIEATADAEAAETAEASDQSKAFAIVFDNSGSMYTSAVWCDTIYSMELFAAMANEGDEIGIYPLNPIEVDGITYTRESPLTLVGGDDASVIRDIYTPSSLDTHIETIEDAYNGLFSMSGEDKWLIILSDGDVYYEDGAALDSEYGTDFSVTQERLSTMLSEYNDSVNVVYLAIGPGATIPVVDGAMYSDVIEAVDASEIPGDVIGISNTIYGREGAVDVSGTLSLSQDMSSLVIYARGEDIGDLRLVDSEGNEAGVQLSTCSLLYAEAPGSGSVELSPTYYEGNADDPSLSGEVVTYGEVPAGTYTVQYDGTASGTRIYYKADVISRMIAEEENAEELAEEDAAYRTAVEEEEEAAPLDEENAREHRGRRAHPVRFRVLLIVFLIIAALAVAAIVILYQKALPDKVRTRIIRFTVNGTDITDGKKPYVRYSGGGGKSGKIVLGPRSGTTNFDYRLTLKLTACSRRYRRSGDRGAVIESFPSNVGYLISYTVDAGTDKYTFTKDGGGLSNGNRTMYLGKSFTYSMEGHGKDETLSEYEPDLEENVEMIIELQFR